MSYRSKVECDRCHLTVDAPRDGGFPEEWMEINMKPSLRGTAESGDKRRRFHLCTACANVVLAGMDVGGRRGN